MPYFEPNEAIDAIENSQLKQILTELVTNLRKKDEQITYPENKVAGLESRVDECETYSSKQYLIMENLPITNDINGNVPHFSHQVCDFLKQHVNYETHPSNYRACHPLKPWKNEAYSPATFVKVMYVSEKNEIYGQKSWLARSLNPNNGEPMF